MSCLLFTSVLQTSFNSTPRCDHYYLCVVTIWLLSMHVSTHTHTHTHTHTLTFQVKEIGMIYPKCRQRCIVRKEL